MSVLVYAYIIEAIGWEGYDVCASDFKNKQWHNVLLYYSINILIIQLYTIIISVIRTDIFRENPRINILSLLIIRKK